MKRIKVKLGDLKSNPFKKEIQNGELNREKIDRLKESIGQSGFWEGIVGREHSGKIQIAFGHHRVQAAKEVLGADYEISIQIGDFNDYQMAVMLGNENSASEGASWAEQVDKVVMFRNLLKSLPKEKDCRVIAGLVQRESTLGGQKAGGAIEQHIHGSEQCIAGFAGERNWSKSKVHRL